MMQKAPFRTPRPGPNNGDDPSLPYGDRLVAYAPFITKMANHYCRKHPANGGPDDFVQDVYELALKRQGKYDEKYSFGTWLHYLCGWVAALRKVKRQTTAGRAIHVEINADRGQSVAPTQETYAELSQVLARLSGRGGEILLRTSMGDELNELGSNMGISKERVRQLKNVARDNLVKSLNNVRRVA